MGLASGTLLLRDSVRSSSPPASLYLHLFLSLPLYLSPSAHSTLVLPHSVSYLMSALLSAGFIPSHCTWIGQKT